MHATRYFHRADSDSRASFGEYQVRGSSTLDSRCLIKYDVDVLSGIVAYALNKTVFFDETPSEMPQCPSNL